MIPAQYQRSDFFSHLSLCGGVKSDISEDGEKVLNSRALSDLHISPALREIS